MHAATATQVPGTSATSNGAHAAFAAGWAGLFAQWMTIVPVVLPDQVARAVGDASKEATVGLVAAAGALVALVVAPVAGAVSDRRIGGGSGPDRRRDLSIGLLGSLAALALFWWANATQRVPLAAIVGAFLALQLGWNWLAGAYAGVVPDRLPRAEHARASGWLNVMTIAGTVGGNLLLAAVYTPMRPGPALLSLAVALAVSVAVVLRAIARSVAAEQGAAAAPAPAATDPPSPSPSPSPSTSPSPSPSPSPSRSPSTRGWLPDRSLHRDFYRVLWTRCCVNMGVWSTLTFLVFYLGDVVRVGQPQPVAAGLLAAGALVAVPASLGCVRWAARRGLVATTRITTWVMALCTAAYLPIALAPQLAVVVPVVLLFSAAYGAYQALDWALALAVLPSRADAGKDMGIWHVAMVLPQVVAPATIGVLVSALRQSVSPGFAYAAAFAIASAWFVVAALWVARVHEPRSD